MKKLNSLTNAVSVRRVWAEVTTPFGQLHFGRMGSHWGLGMFHNEGNGHFTERALVAGVSVASDGKARAGMGTAFGDVPGFELVPGNALSLSADEVRAIESLAG